jgi:hypothetical protein
MTPLASVRLIAGIRACIGLALTVAPEPLLRVMVRNEEPTGSLVIFARTVGIRDAVFGLGSLVATKDKERATDLRRWLAAWLVSDVADVITGLTSAERIGRGGSVVAAVVPLPFVVAGARALHRLSAATV